nr:MAG: replication initiator protein [Microvirus sp.]
MTVVTAAELEEMRCTSPLKTYGQLASSPGTKLLRVSRCGYCRACRVHKQQSWIARLWAESLCNGYGQFVTLTFRNEHLAKDLTVRPLQLFLKRLRKSSPGKIRYLCSGEYGSKTRRFHYHGIIFSNGCPIPPNVLEDKWSYGFVSISPIIRKMSSFRYVTKYCWKNADDPKVVVMSRMPGLGYRTFFTLGQRLAESGSKHMPNFCEVEGRKYPLDRTVRDYISAGYYSVTGGILAERSSPIVTDMRLRLEAMVGLVDERGEPVTVSLYHG